jgi:phosphatidylethanolamine N-methyltransferase
MTQKCSFNKVVRSWSSRTLRFYLGCVRMRPTLDLHSRVTNDLAGVDISQYQMSVTPNDLGSRNRFHVGEVIRVRWKAPSNHSRRDWIGIYRVCAYFLRSGLLNDKTLQVGANKDRSVTKVASMGMWAPVHRDEWDDETLLEAGTQMIDSQSGEVVFRGGTLPWKTGTYEV